MLSQYKMTTRIAASAKLASGAAAGNQATRPASRGQRGMSDRQRQGSTVAMTALHTTSNIHILRPKRVLAIKPLNTNDPPLNCKKHHRQDACHSVFSMNVMKNAKIQTHLRIL